MPKSKRLTVTAPYVAEERAILGIVRRVAAEPRDRKQARLGRELAKYILASKPEDWGFVERYARELLAVGEKQGGGE